MAATYQLISSVTVGAGGASSIDFTSIPATYTDLVLKASLRNGYTGDTADWVYLKLNNNTSSYSYRLLQANPPSVGSYNNTTQFIADIDTANATSNTFGNLEVYLPNYAGSNYKSYSIDAVTELNATGNILDLTTALWSNTTAINQITLTPRNSTLVQYSSAYLYGIKNS